MITLTPVGRLTKDADLKYLSNGTPRAAFTLACKRRHQDKNGNDRTTYVNCVLFGKGAEAFANYTRKGSLVSVFGELTTRSYDDQQGNTQYVTEVVVETFEFLESRKITEERAQNTNRPIGNQDSQYQSEKSNDQTEIPDEDIPYYG